MNLSACLRRLGGFGRDERGATAIIVALSGVMLIGMMGLVVDVGRVMVAQRALQAATDAAALAGAYNIPAGTAVTAATTYSATSGQKNASASYTTTMVSGYPLLECLTSTGVTCVTVGAQASANAIQVKQQTIVPMFFAQVFGVNTMTVTAVSTAGARGGQGQNLSVMIILDATNSMGNADTYCSITGATREGCALAGVRSLLNGLSPSADYVGLMQFPQLSSTPTSSCASMPALTRPTGPVRRPAIKSPVSRTRSRARAVRPPWPAVPASFRRPAAGPPVAPVSVHRPPAAMARSTVTPSPRPRPL